MPSPSRIVRLVPGALGLAVGSLAAGPAHAASAELHAGFLRTLLLHLFGLDPGGQGPRCAGFRACDLAFVAIVGLLVFALVRLRHATARRRLDLARRMVEQGMEPPAELLLPPGGNDLRRGLVLVFAGVGLLAASFLGERGDLGPAGLIPGFIGLGYLVSHLFGRKRGPSP